MDLSSQTQLGCSIHTFLWYLKSWPLICVVLEAAREHVVWGKGRTVLDGIGNSDGIGGILGFSALFLWLSP